VASATLDCSRIGVSTRLRWSRPAARREAQLPAAMGAPKCNFGAREEFLTQRRKGAKRRHRRRDVLQGGICEHGQVRLTWIALDFAWRLGRVDEWMMEEWDWRLEDSDWCEQVRLGWIAAGCWRG
jgi:hypothetical protein